MVIGQLANGLIASMLIKLMLNDVPHATMFGNPDPVSPGTTSDIVSRTGMKEYEYKWFPPPPEERPRRVYPYTRTKNIGNYQLRMTRSDSTYTIKLLEFLEGWKSKLRATWSSLDKAECNAKFEQIADVIKQVRFEHKTALMR